MIPRGKKFAVLTWFIVFYAYWWLHEFAGHYLTNLICGIPISQMEIIGLRVGNILILPVAISIIDSETPRISHFMGGAISALVLISASLVFFKLYKIRRKERFFSLFSVTLGIACIGLLEIIIEPFFPDYHRTLLNAIILIAVAIIVPIVINRVHLRKHDGELIW